MGNKVCCHLLDIESQYEPKIRTSQNTTILSIVDEDSTNIAHINNLLNKDDHRIFVKKDHEIIDEHDKIHLEDFQIFKMLGKGSFGKVLLVRKKDNGHLYAMKVLKKDLIIRRNQKFHVLTEKSILETSHCSFITQLHYAFQSNSKLYLVMDFVQGGELLYYMNKLKHFKEEYAKFYAAEIIISLEFLHSKKTIYRDLKPENILIDNLGHIKLTDFGLSKQGLEYKQQTYSFCGTIDYLAPEIILNKGHDKAVDWWSLGILIYELVSGYPPFYGKNRENLYKKILEEPLNLLPFFSKDLCNLLSGLLCVMPEKRLGYSETDAFEIKNHPWFAEINWEDVKYKKMEPPIKPNISGIWDLKYFSNDILLDSFESESNNQSKKFEDFEGFSYRESKTE